MPDGADGSQLDGAHAATAGSTADTGVMTSNRARVEQACQELLTVGQPVTMAEIAARSGIGRSTLYRRPELRAVVDEHRQRQRDALTPIGPVQIGQLGQDPDKSSGRTRSLTPWAGPVILLAAVGALGQAWISYQGRTTGSPSPVLFYLTLCLIYMPSAALILSRKLSDNAKIGLSLYMSLTVLSTRFLQYPTAFAYHDELVHQAIATSIDQTGHLFHPLNSVLPEASYYPGMEIFTTALQHATGMSLHSAGWTMLAIAETITTLALIVLIRRITGNVSVACLVVLVYACNQEALAFNTEFSYASLALPLALFCIYVFAIRDKSARWYGLIPSIAVFVALAATHHLTSLAVVILLWAWNRAAQLTGRRVPQLGIFFAVSILILAIWTWFARAYVISYIQQALSSAASSIYKLINGGSSRKLFVTPAGYKTPEWEIIVSFGSVLLIVLILIPAGWYAVRRWRLAGAAGIVLTALALLYPVIPFGHLTADSSEVADRSAAFVFAGVGYVIAIWWFHQLKTDRDARRTFFNQSRRRPTFALVVGLTICFVGGGIIGGADWSYVPGSYMVIADNRSIDQLSLAAGYWEAANIKPGSRVVTDRDNGLVAQSYGGLHQITGAADGVDVASMSTLLLRHPSVTDVSTVCADRVQYLISDVRLSTGLPEMGVYIDAGEYLDGTRSAPPSVADLTKFDQVPGAERIYDNGAIRIYDLEGVSCPG